MAAWDTDERHEELPDEDPPAELVELHGPVCSRCGENEVPFEPAFCGPCVFAIRAEAQEGLRRLSDYLSAWARFDEWDDDHGRGRLAA